MQSLPSGQIFPHEPQFNKSTLVSVQDPLQRANPSEHAELSEGSARPSINPQFSDARIKNIKQLIYFLVILSSPAVENDLLLQFLIFLRRTSNIKLYSFPHLRINLRIICKNATN